MPMISFRESPSIAVIQPLLNPPILDMYEGIFNINRILFMYFMSILLSTSNPIVFVDPPVITISIGGINMYKPFPNG